MKRSFLLITFLSFILLSGNAVFAQGLKLGIGGGLTSVQGPDGFTNSLDNGGAGFSSEYHYGIKAKLSVPLVPLTPYAHITNHKFTGSFEDTFGKYETSLSILQIGAGVEMSVIPGPISPYFALEVALNNFGDFEYKSTAILDVNHTDKGESRFGGAIGAGMEITILPLVNFDVSAKYNWFNLVGKKDNEETVSAFTLNVLVMFTAL